MIDDPTGTTVEGTAAADDYPHLKSSHGLSTLKFNLSSRKRVTAVLCDKKDCDEHPFQEGPAAELEDFLGEEFKGGNIVELDIQESTTSSRDQTGEGLNPEFEDDDDGNHGGGQGGGGGKDNSHPTKVAKGAVKHHKGLASTTVRGPPQLPPGDGNSTEHTDTPHGSREVHIRGHYERTTVVEEDIDITDPISRTHLPGPAGIHTEGMEGEEGGGHRRVHVRGRIEKITVEEEETEDIDTQGGGGHQHGGIGVIVGGTVIGGRRPPGGPAMIVPGQWEDMEESERGVISWGVADDIPPSIQDGVYVDTTMGAEPVMIIPPQRTEPPRPVTPVVVYRPQPRPVLREPPPRPEPEPEPEEPGEPEPIIIIAPPRPKPQYRPPPRVLVRPPEEPIYVEPPSPPRPVIIQQRQPSPPPMPEYRPPVRVIPPPPPPIYVPEPEVVVAEPEPMVFVPEPEPVPEYGTYETIVPGAVGGISAYEGDIGGYGGGISGYGGDVSAYQGVGTGGYGGAYGGVGGMGGAYPGGFGGVSGLNRGNSIASVYEYEQGYHDVASVYDDRTVASIHELENEPGMIGAGAGAVVDPYGYDGYGNYGAYGGYGAIPGGPGPVIAGAAGLAYGQHLVSAAHVASDHGARVHRDHSAEDDMALESAAFINNRRLGRGEEGDEEQVQTWQVGRNPQQYQESEESEQASNAFLGRQDRTLSQERSTQRYSEGQHDHTFDQDTVMAENEPVDREFSGNQHMAFPSDSADNESSYHEVQLEEGPAAMQELAIETYFDTTKSQLKVRQQQGQLLTEMASQLKKRQQQEQERERQQQQQVQQPSSLEEQEIQASDQVISRSPPSSPSPGIPSLSQQLQQQQSPPTLNIPKPPSNPPPVRLLANRGVPTPLVLATPRGSVPIAFSSRKVSEVTTVGNLHFIAESNNVNADGSILPGEEENGSEPPILSTSASASENIMMQLRNRNSGTLADGPTMLPSQPFPLTTDATAAAAGSAVSRARALISGSVLMGTTATLSNGKGMADTRSYKSLKHASKDQGARATASALAASKRRRREGERVAAMSRSHLHPILLTEGVMACWNNEFAYALEVFKENGTTFPRWSLATAEVLFAAFLIQLLYSVVCCFFLDWKHSHFYLWISSF